MAFLNKALAIKKTQFGDYINTLVWKAWVPKFVVLHNTGVPSLANWQENLKKGHTPIELMANQKHYERDIQHWHSGVHFFCPPGDDILVLCNPVEDGVHCSCWNHLSFGIEMVGDYSKEPFDTGLGAQVRDNAVIALAALHKKFSWEPAPLVQGVKGLHMHKMCTKDHHDCPGKNVSLDDMVKRVNATMHPTTKSIA